MNLSFAGGCATIALLALSLNQVLAGGIPSQVLVDDPFVLGYNQWIDTFSGVPVDNAPPSWRYHFQNGTLMESSDGRAGDGNTNAGDYAPYLLVHDGLVTPGDYTINASFRMSDDDGLGLVFGWQDNDNYFRLGLRQQSSGNLGFTRGVAVQKVVNGVSSQISPAGPGKGNTTVPTLSMVDSRLPLNVSLRVNGSAWEVYAQDFNGMVPLISGDDAELSAGTVGVLSWGQRRRESDAIRPPWGTEIESFSVVDSSGGTLLSDDFSNPSSVSWRSLQMANALGLRLNETGLGANLGNFGLRFDRGTITEDSNGFEYASNAAPNVDFIGPSIVVDTPGSDDFGDYELKLRMENHDNDGLGVLIRVEDDDNYYRVNFAQQPMLPPNDAGQDWQRPPRGMSVQKVRNGDWTELFRDDQQNPLFVYDPDIPFDVRVRAVGNQMQVEVVRDPDGVAQTIRFPLIVDDTDPLLGGTIGLTSWASGIDNLGAEWSPFGGEAGTPFLVSISAIPEPSSKNQVLFVGLVCCCLLRTLKREAGLRDCRSRL